jgi:hypothetical protein
MIDYFEQQIQSRKSQTRFRYRHYSQLGGVEWKNRDFRCGQCHSEVSTATWLAGVHNRNHCPYCLWSKHMDLWEAGDRLSACKAGMRPVALTFKQSRKKYSGKEQGELMIVHACTECGKLSINRIAADDDAATILEIFENSLRPDPGVLGLMACNGIRILTEEERPIVQARVQTG